MILTVLALGGTILAATTIAGLLTLYQIRQTTNFADSARAISASDAGIEEALFNVFKNTSFDCYYLNPSLGSGTVCNLSRTFANGSSYAATVTGFSTVRSVGTAGTAKRAFLLSLPTATTTAP